MISFKYFDHTTRVRFGTAEMVISDAESEVSDGLKSIAEGLDEAVAEHGDEICQQIMAQDSLVDLLHRAIQVRNLRDAIQDRNLTHEENAILRSLLGCPVKWVQNEAKAALYEASMPIGKPISESMASELIHQYLLRDPHQNGYYEQFRIREIMHLRRMMKTAGFLAVKYAFQSAAAIGHEKMVRLEKKSTKMERFGKRCYAAIESFTKVRTVS